MLRDKTINFYGKDNMEFVTYFYKLVNSYYYEDKPKAGMWKAIAGEMNSRFNLNCNSETYRSMYDRLRYKYNLKDSRKWESRGVERLPSSELFNALDRNREAKQNEDRIYFAPDQEQDLHGRLPKNHSNLDDKTPKNIDKAILDMLEKPATAEKMAYKFGLSEYIIEVIIERLIMQGHNISKIGKEYFIERRPIIADNIYDAKWEGAQEIRFGVAADTHNGNKFQQLTALGNFYDICADKNVDVVYHAGDITDGLYKERPEHIYELFARGADEQAVYVMEHYPKKKTKDGRQIKTKLITGNHDFTHVRNGGVDVGRIIAAGRDDFEYLGYGKSRVMLTPNCSMDLMHPIDGKAYALSYRLQKNIDAMQGGTKPNILLCGHYHAFCNIWYRNVHAYMLPCFMAQNTWSTLRSMMVQVGGLIYTVTVAKDGSLLSVLPQLISYYEMKANDY